MVRPRALAALGGPVSHGCRCCCCCCSFATVLVTDSDGDDDDGDDDDGGDDDGGGFSRVLEAAKVPKLHNIPRPQHSPCSLEIPKQGQLPQRLN